MREKRIEVDRKNRAPGLAPLKSVHEFVVCDAVDPRRKAPREVETLYVLVGLYENILHDILRIVRIKQEFASITDELSLIAFNEFTKGLSISCLDAPCYRFVRFLRFFRFY